MKFTEEEVINAVKRVLEDGSSVNGSAKSIGMSKSTLQDYVNRAREHDYSCLLKSHKNRSYTGDYKVHVVEFMRQNHLSTYSTPTGSL